MPLRCINNRLVVENHKHWWEVLYEMRRSWPGTRFCLQLPEHPPPHASQTQVAQLAHGKLWGWARYVFQLSREGSGGRRESRLQCLSTPGTVPGTAHCLREEAKLLSSFPPCSLTQPTAKEELNPGIMQIRVWTEQNQSQKTKNEQLAVTVTKIINK